MQASGEGHCLAGTAFSSIKPKAMSPHATLSPEPVSSGRGLSSASESGAPSPFLCFETSQQVQAKCGLFVLVTTTLHSSDRHIGDKSASQRQGHWGSQVQGSSSPGLSREKLREGVLSPADDV